MRRARAQPLDWFTRQSRCRRARRRGAPVVVRRAAGERRRGRCARSARSAPPRTRSTVPVRPSTSDESPARLRSRRDRGRRGEEGARGERARWVRRRSCPSHDPDTTITRVLGARVASSSMTRGPLAFGITRSRRTRSAAHPTTDETTAAPSSHSPTMSTSDSLSKNFFNPARTSG